MQKRAFSLKDRRSGSTDKQKFSATWQATQISSNSTGSSCQQKKENCPKMVFEWVDTGDLKYSGDPFARRGKFSLRTVITESNYFKKLKNVRKFMFDLLNGLEAMHKKGVMHRDIKPSNLVISTEGTLKILDFDLSEFLAPGNKFQYSVATRGFKPPEVQLEQTDYDYRFDVYSAGAMMASILFRSANFFGFHKGEEAWHCTTLVRGIDALMEIDFDNAIGSDYIRKH